MAVSEGVARPTDELDDREAEMYRLRVVNRWTLARIGERFGVCNQRVSQILQGVKAKLPPLDAEALRQASIALHQDTIRRAFELVELPGAPVFVGRDGAMAFDIGENGEKGEPVRDYSGRLAALETARKADVELRKLLGLDAATKQEILGSIRYEIAGWDPSTLT